VHQIGEWFTSPKIPLPAIILGDIMDLHKNEKWLRARYLDDGLSTYKMGDLAGVNPSTINANLRINEIPLRDSGRKPNHVVLTQEAIDVINGGLLGDWSIVTLTAAARFQTASKYLELVEWSSNVLNGFGIESMPSGIYHSLITLKGGYGPYNTYTYGSRTYREFLPLRELWYPNGKKVIPKGLILSPATMLWLYIGDGSLHCGRKKSQKSSINLATCGFTSNDVRRLVQLLKNIGINAAFREYDNMIGISTKSTPAFLSYIGPCPKPIEAVYGYKWDLSRRGTIEDWRKKTGFYPRNHN